MTVEIHGKLLRYFQRHYRNNKLTSKVEELLATIHNVKWWLVGQKTTGTYEVYLTDLSLGFLLKKRTLLKLSNITCYAYPMSYLKSNLIYKWILSSWVLMLFFAHLVDNLSTILSRLLTALSSYRALLTGFLVHIWVYRWR